MRIILDIQSFHTSSRLRGIGRYTLNHAKEFIRQNDGNEIFLLINDANSGSLEYVRKEFSDLVPDDNIIIFPLPLRLFDSEDKWSEGIKNGIRDSVALLREAFISQLRPDFVLIYSHFEFFSRITSIKRYYSVPTGLIVYDFIPMQDDMAYFKKLPEFMRNMYLECLKESENADLIFAISDFVADDAKRILNKEDGIYSISSACGDFWQPEDVSSEDKKDFLKKYSIKKPFILYSGGIYERKNVKRLIQAYSLLDESIRSEYSLFVICGENIRFKKDLEAYAASFNMGDSISFSGYVSDKDLRTAYRLCSLFVFPPLSEGFGLTPLEAMSCGAPVIGSDAASIPEVIGFKKALFNPESSESISDKIAEALTDRDFYSLLKENALARAKEFSWKRTASKTWKLINDYCLSVRKDSCSPILKMECIREMSKAIQPFKGDKPFIRELSRCIYDIYADKKNKKSIYIDLSVLSKSDAGTGIQRVSRNIRDLLPEAASGYDVAPVRKCRTMTGYEYSRKFLNSPRCDSVIYPQRGDVLFFPELTMPQVIAQKNYLLQLKERGVKLIVLIHDLIPIRHPETCQEKILSFFSDFIDIIAFFDVVICNSKATADDFEKWLAEKFPQRHGVCFIDWFHLGSDLGGKHKSGPSDEFDESVVSLISQKKTFLMVSTIEPRKKYDQAIDAFDELWSSGIDVNLVIVGKAGWKVEELIDRINSHKENGKRLFWLSGISDAYLEKVYESSDCLIMASLSEGFGLAITEAAYRNKPLIVRDIPVFREIVGENAFYFDGMDGNALADCIRKWLKLYDRGEYPKSDGIKSLTWRQSVEMLFDRLQRYM